MTDLRFPTQRLSEALVAIQALSDSEQEILDSWLSGAMRNELRTAGVSDDEIGPPRKNIDYWAGDFVERPVQMGSGSSPTLVNAVRALRDLTDAEIEAIASWFRHEDRSELWALGADNEIIGPMRKVPDQR